MLQSAIDKRTYKSVEQNNFADIMSFSKCLLSLSSLRCAEKTDYTNSDYT